MSEREKCKVGRLVDGYDLDSVVTRHGSVNEHLLARWRGEDGRDPEGYRRLTEWFNLRLFKRAYDRNSRPTMGARLESEYEALTGEDELTAMEVREDLEASGIDVDGLLADTVSWSTMRNHLKGCLDAEKDRSGSTTDWERRSIEIARDHAASTVTEAVKSLSSKGELSRGEDADVSVRVDLSCPDCPTRVPLDTALDRGFVCRDHLSAGAEGPGEHPTAEGDPSPQLEVSWSLNGYRRDVPSFGI